MNKSPSFSSKVLEANMEHLTLHQIEQRIFIIRDHKVMIDRDLAELYEVKTWAINQAVKRNPGRFPSDFVFQLTLQEKNELITHCDRLSSLGANGV